MLSSLFKSIQESARPTIQTIDGRDYATVSLSPVKDPTQSAIELSTLTGLVDYIKANTDKMVIESLICHVESPTSVALLSSLHGKFAQRSEFIRVTARVREFEFGKFLDSEKFNISLQSCFAESPITLNGEERATDKALVLKYVGNVRSEIAQTVGDDGTSQQMTVKTGVASVGDVILPNPVILRPFRTFNEVQQPASQFVFRAQEGPRFALIEADNGAWESEAMKNIKSYLESEVPTLTIIA